MCLAIPACVVEIPEVGVAKVEIGGVRRVVSSLLLDGDELRVGDWVLIHVGFALAKVDEAEAAATLRLLDGLREEEPECAS